MMLRCYKSSYHARHDGERGVLYLAFGTFHAALNTRVPGDTARDADQLPTTAWLGTSVGILHRQSSVGPSLPDQVPVSTSGVPRYG
jgi:hypothetical protein